MPPEDPARPFSTWMEQALFAPGTGYYAARIRTVGRQGDFATSATTSPLLGEAVAGWILEELAAQRGVRSVIEVGGGDGSLSARVRQSLGWWRRRKLAWHLVETSPVLRAKQQERLAGAQWHETMESALQACEGRALIFHNELVDAFPVTLLEWSVERTAWQEIWVSPAAGGAGWQEEVRPWKLEESEASQFSVLQSWKDGSPPPQKRQRVELHCSFRHWLGSWAPLWRAGAMLTVDYGDLFPQVYHRRPQGTLRAYLLHQRLTGAELYLNMGRQDITADVNFTDLLKWGQALGWRDGTVVTQAEFLQARIPRLERRMKSSEANQFVGDGAGAGAAFKVWSVRRVS